MSDSEWDYDQAAPATMEALKHGRRLSDKILIAFHHACDKKELRTAEELLGTLGRLIARPVPTETADRRKVAETLADGNYRLWDLKRHMSHGPASAGASEPVFDQDSSKHAQGAVL